MNRMSERAERKVPPMPIWTSLERLQREHERLRKLPRKRMLDSEWHEYLAEVLPIRPEEV